MFSRKFHHLPNTNGAHMYAPRMPMDSRFGYPTYIPRHGNPSLNHVPPNFNMQVYKLGDNLKQIITVFDTEFLLRDYMTHTCSCFQAFASYTL